ncbi:hypothetical protein BH24ACT26_BH24ACT26_20470 [soil metagenome]
MTRVLRRGDAEWPGRLGELGPHRPPEKLFAEGAPLEPEVPAVAVVGTRRPSATGRAAAYEIAGGLAEAGWIVVSGLAVGVDAVAHRAALEAGGRTVAVLGCGLDVGYPARNLELKARIVEQGTLITEYAFGAPPAKHHFPMRNRIIAGAALGVVVVEGSMRSGALVTARLGLDMNRSVFAVPGSPRNPMAEGPNELIRTSQAALVTEVSHVFEDLAPGLAWREQDRSGSDDPARHLTDDENGVLRALDDVPLGIDQLARDLDLAPGRIAILLSQLEVRGLVVRWRGGYARSSAGSRRAS